MTTLVLGATGATGKLLVKQLLDRDEQVRVIVRSAERLAEDIRNHNNLTILEASILDLDDKILADYVKDCDAVASCLGHNLTFKGIFLPPRKLVTDAIRKVCRAIKTNHLDQRVKFVLMNTTGNRNRDLSEKISFGEQIVVGLVRFLVPPQSDNEQAADYLRVDIGHDDPVIEWSVVRPDGLVNETEVSDYDVHPSPIRSAIFNPGITSRINVGNFMAKLITDKDAWNQWKGQMPVIYNQA